MRLDRPRESREHHRHFAAAERSSRVPLFFHSSNASELAQLAPFANAKGGIVKQLPRLLELTRSQLRQLADEEPPGWPFRRDSLRDARAVAALAAARGDDKPHASCAVVGSAAALLASSAGAEIDEHELVVRINQAPTVGWEEHVGSRTDLRVWGFIPLPRDQKYRRTSEWAAGAAGERFLIYCPPVRWVGKCWWDVQRLGESDPRFHPLVWQLAADAICGRRARANCFPSTGAMAIIFALRQCRRVSLFGFGAGNASETQCAARRADGTARLRCEISRVCGKYYSRVGEPVELKARLQLCREAAANRTMKLRGRDRQPLGSADYFAESAKWHNLSAEWAWFERLQRRGKLVWRTGPTNSSRST